MQNKGVCTLSVVQGLAKVPGNIEDVIRLMIAHAKSIGCTASVEMGYGGVVLNVKADSDPSEIRTRYEQVCYARRMRPHLRLVSG